MINPEEIKKMASLARIRVSEEELPKLSKDIESILGYVSELEKIEVGNAPQHVKHSMFNMFNILREDINPHETGIYTENILINSPRRQGDYVVVKKIL